MTLLTPDMPTWASKTGKWDGTCSNVARDFVKNSRVRLKCDGTRWRTGGEVKGKLANGVGSQYLHTTSEHGVSSITTTDTHTAAVSIRLNWGPPPRPFKWIRPFRRKTKSLFCACATTFQTQSTECASCRVPKILGPTLKSRIVAKQRSVWIAEPFDFVHLLRIALHVSGYEPGNRAVVSWKKWPICWDWTAGASLMSRE